MIRTLTLEWLKLKNYRVFWILLGMYMLALIVIAAGGGLFLEWLKHEGADFQGIDPTILPIYDFPDIWQNLTYLASFGIILLCFIVIISVTNDISYNTLRQNIIDGISKREYLMSKMMLIFSLAAISTSLLLVLVIIQGAIFSHVWGSRFIFDELEFVAVYFYQIVLFCTMAFLLSLIVKKPGFVIVGLMLYALMFEPIATTIFEKAPPFREGWMPEIVQYFPIKSMNNLIKVPFGRYIFKEIQDYVSLKAVAISVGWFAIYLSGIVFILKRRDLKS
jgi:ABC-type transport system involved in multi-copper enzyme maturation permease subunit